MPNLLTTSADWLSDQQKEHCGTGYQYDRDGFVLDVVLVPDVRRDQHRSDLPEDEAIFARSHVFHAKAADLAEEEGGPRFLPESGHRIIREVDGEEPQEYVVFPAFGQQVFKYTDPSQSILRVYAVSVDELEQVHLELPLGDEFNVYAIASDIRGEMEQEPESGKIVKVMRQTVHIPTKSLKANGVTELLRNVVVSTSRYTDWGVDLASSRWGAGRVTLELRRNPISALNNKER